MSRWIILPYDNSPVARATLHRAAKAVRQTGTCYAGLLLAVAGIDPADLNELAREACMVAGPGVLLDVVLLTPGDPLGDLARLIASRPDAVLAAPLGARGTTPWYREACKAEGIPCVLMLFFLQPAEVRRFAAAADVQSQPGVLRQCLERMRGWFRPSARRPEVGNGTKSLEAADSRPGAPRPVSGQPLLRTEAAGESEQSSAGRSKDSRGRV
jgi:hypothetical protein